MKFPLALMLATCLSASLAKAADKPDSMGVRLERIRALAADLVREVDSLERDIAARPRVVDSGVAAHPRGTEPRADSAGPILGEIMSATDRKLAAAAATPFQRLAAGYSFDPDMPIAMHFLAWGARWGGSANATARSGNLARQAGGELALLRSLHRFALFAGLQTHLYAFAGSGLFWRREPYPSYFLEIPGTIPFGRDWYGNPDIYARLRVGAGSELGLIALGGIKATPEIGFTGRRYFSRYQDSREWEAIYARTPGFDEKPQSDFSLGIYFAFHLSFYFL